MGRFGYLVVMVMAACDAGPKPPAPPQTPISNTPPPVLFDATVLDGSTDLVDAALLRVKADPSSLSDHGLVGSNVYVVIEPGTTKRALPAPFVAMTHAELDAEADRKGAAVGFIHVYGVELKGDNASLTIGGDIALPAKDRAHKLCCCESTDQWARRDGKWIFGGSTMSICS